MGGPIFNWSYYLTPAVQLSANSASVTGRTGLEAVMPASSAEEKFKRWSQNPRLGFSLIRQLRSE
jgi:hypothetical protein